MSFADGIDRICRLDVRPDTMRRNKNDMKDFDEV